MEAHQVAHLALNYHIMSYKGKDQSHHKNKADVESLCQTAKLHTSGIVTT